MILFAPQPEPPRQLQGVDEPIALVHEINLNDESISAAFRTPNTIDLPFILSSKPEPLLTAVDGAFLAGDKKAYSGNSNFEELPFLEPACQQPALNLGRLIYINGICTDAKRASSEMESIAQVSGMKVLGIYNQTDEAFWDVVQAIGDKANSGSNPACDTLYRSLNSVIERGEEICILGQSHGSLIISRALERLVDNLSSKGLNSEQIEQQLSKLTVITFGTPAWNFPDGPKYIHYINENDPIPLHFGLGRYGISSTEIDQRIAGAIQPFWLNAIGKVLDFAEIDLFMPVHPGKGARVVTVTTPEPEKKEWWDAHMASEYCKHWANPEALKSLSEVRQVSRDKKEYLFAGVKAAIAVALLSFLTKKVLNRFRTPTIAVTETVPPEATPVTDEVVAPNNSSNEKREAA